MVQPETNESFAARVSLPRRPRLHGLLALAFFLAGRTALAADEAPAAFTSIEALDAKVQYEKALLRARAKYRQQLKKILPKIEEKNDAAEAERIKTALAELERAAETSTKPAPGKLPTFVWEDEKEWVKYVYKENTFGRGKLYFGDDNCQKLLDGQAAPKFDARSVGWDRKTPSPIVFTFREPAAPATLKVFLLGSDVGGNIAAPAQIRVYAGEADRKRELVGKLTEIPDHSGWVEVPLKFTAPAAAVWLELDRSPQWWVMIDEVEFE